MAPRGLVSRRNLSRLSWLAALAVVLAVGARSSVLAATPCPAVATETGAVLELLPRDPHAALTRAETLAAACPAERSAHRLLAAARRASSDLPGAIRGLEDHLAIDPLDCESWSWLAWLELERGDHARAWQVLQAPSCPDTPEMASRFALLEAWLRRDLQDPAAGAALARVGDRAVLLPEDASLWAALQRQLDATWMPRAALDGELGLGATSDAFAGSPVDTTLSGVGSALARLRLSAYLAAPDLGGVAPFVATDVKGHGIEAEEARELSYLELGGRAGFSFKLGSARMRLAYRREALFLDVPDNSRYTLADRGELELELPGKALVLAGGGHREYQDPWRTRRELDAGLVVPFTLAGFGVTAGMSARSYSAARAVYDQQGLSITAMASHALGHGLSGRLAVLLSGDDYPDSGGLEGLIAFGSREKRRDLGARLQLGVARTLGSHLGVAVTLEHARRSSTIDPGLYGSFAYRETKLMVSVRAALAGNPWRGRPEVAEDHVPLDYGQAPQLLPLDLGGVRDMLRQEEELRRDCGCTPH